MKRGRKAKAGQGSTVTIIPVFDIPDLAAFQKAEDILAVVKQLKATKAFAKLSLRSRAIPVLTMERAAQVKTSDDLTALQRRDRDTSSSSPTSESDGGSAKGDNAKP